MKLPRPVAAAMAVAALVAIAAPLYFDRAQPPRDAALQNALRLMRDAIDKFYTDNARYPEALGDLVEKRYLREVPADPVTGSAQTWVLVSPPEGSSVKGRIFDVKSGAGGKTPDGVEFAKL
jgi:general secretion pathway protein G